MRFACGADPARRCGLDARNRRDRLAYTLLKFEIAIYGLELPVPQLASRNGIRPPEGRHENSAGMFWKVSSPIRDAICTGVVPQRAARSDPGACGVQRAGTNALKIPNLTVVSSTFVSAAAPNPDYCDVKGTVITSGEGAEPGAANFEIILPQNWNRKFIFHGVGGLAGTLYLFGQSRRPGACFWRKAMPPQSRTRVI